jgi:type II secretory ATPase GspE/PulE/Tfp pilus assembly ATPase PilB-like protein
MHSGVRGRTGIFELLRLTDSLRELIAARPTTEQIVKAAPPDHISMRHDGIAKVLEGITTPEEILRVTQGINEEE